MLTLTAPPERIVADVCFQASPLGGNESVDIFMKHLRKHMGVRRPGFKHRHHYLPALGLRTVALFL